MLLVAKFELLGHDLPHTRYMCVINVHRNVSDFKWKVQLSV